MAMTAKQNQNATNRKKPKTVYSNGWSDLIPDILFLIVMQLGIEDFVAFSTVCKTWRSVALSISREFMLSRKPMTIYVSPQVAKRKECYLTDHEGRRFTTILPRSSNRIYVGLASGHIVLFGRKTRDFRLVNPVTRHELHFPCCLFHVVTDPDAFKGTLVFSPTASSWVFLISATSSTVSFSLSSKHASWTHLSSNIPILDLKYFQGKIYTLNTGLRICEVKLDHEPTLTLLEMEHSVSSHVTFPWFATLGEKLLVIGSPTFEVDFDQMKWVIFSAALEEYPCFVRVFNFSVSKLEFWDEPYTRFGYFNGIDKDINEHMQTSTDTWYFPHKCLDHDRLHE